MSDGFAESARRLAGLVSRALGWRPAEFWTATPAELATILRHDGETAAAPLTRDELSALLEHESHG